MRGDLAIIRLQKAGLTTALTAVNPYFLHARAAENGLDIPNLPSAIGEMEHNGYGAEG